MVQAMWNRAVLADSDDTVVIEGNHYFPADALNREHFRESDTTSFCPWKGTANYYHVVVDGEINRDAAWVYRTPEEAARPIAGRIAFWNGVQVI